MDLNRVGQRFEQTFIKEDGYRFKGAIYAPPASQTKSTTFFSARRILKVDNRQNVSEGTCFQMPSGIWNLCFDVFEGFFYEPNFKMFGLIDVTEKAKWKRPIMGEDPVRKTPIRIGWEDLGDIRFAKEPVREEVDPIKIPKMRYRILTGKAIRDGDLIGETPIKSVESTLGIFLAYV